MRHHTYTIIVALMFATVLGATLGMAQTRIGFRLEFGDRPQPVNDFYVTVGNYYHVPYGQVCALHDMGISDDDVPVVLFIYANSHYSLQHVARLRSRGATWVQLSSWCGVPLEAYGDYARPYRSGPPYGNAYGYYRHGPGRWREENRMTDDDIYNFAHRPFRQHERDDDGRYGRHHDD